ncbi:hypothetical protein CsSME_00015023 [Camellia sinensis var. sinensis]
MVQGTNHSRTLHNTTVPYLVFAKLRNQPHSPGIHLPGKSSVSPTFREDPYQHPLAKTDRDRSRPPHLHHVSTIGKSK